MNKRIIIIAFALMFKLGFSQGVSIDTIYTNMNNSITFEFDSKVEYIIIGNNPYIDKGAYKDYKFYDQNYIDKIVVLIAKRIDAPITTIIIKTENEIYHGYISFAINVKKTFVSYKKAVSIVPVLLENEIIENSEVKESSGVKEEMSVDDKINSIVAQKVEYFEYVDMIGNVYFQIGNVIHDKNYCYLKLIIQNESSTTFKVNGILFRYEEGQKTLFNKKEVMNKEWIDPFKIHYPKNQRIEAYTFENIGICIPIYSGNQGELIIKILEEYGERTCILKIPAKTLNLTKIY